MASSAGVTLANYLQSELLSLSNEARRRHPEIKEAAEKVIIAVRSLKDKPPPSNIFDELSKMPDLVRPFLLACETKQAKMVAISISCIQRLISSNSISPQSIQPILQTLSDIMSSGVEIQLKVLQTVLPLLTNYKSINGPLLAEALLLCFKLQESKTVVVHNTAAATLRQVVILLFEKVATDTNNEEEVNSPPLSPIHLDSPAVPPSVKDAYLLMKDLCFLINNEEPQFLKLVNLPTTFGLELIESVLTNHYKIFKKQHFFSSLLKDKVCPLIIKSFSDKHEFPEMMRLMRVIYILIKHFHESLIMECEIFLSMFIKLLDPDTVSWQRVLCLEIFRGICGDFNLQKSLFRSYDRREHSLNIFQEMVIAIHKVASEKPELLLGQMSMGNINLGDSVSTSFEGLSLQTCTMKMQCIDQHDKAEPPIIPVTYIPFLALMCFILLVDGYHNYITPLLQTSKSGSGTDLADSAVQAEISLCSDMIKHSWQGILTELSFFVLGKLDDELYTNVLKAYQNFTCICGFLYLKEPRDAFLTSLCKMAVPVDPFRISDLSGSVAPVTMSDKNMSCLRAVLNISQRLAAVLDEEAWLLILCTLQLADSILFGGNDNGSDGVSAVNSPNSNLSPSSLSGPSNDISKITEAATVFAVFKGLFEYTQTLSWSSFAPFVKALCKLTQSHIKGGLDADQEPDLDQLPDTSSIERAMRKTSLVGKKGSSTLRSFSIARLRDIIILNIARLTTPEGAELWKHAVDHLTTLVIHDGVPQTYKSQACEAIADITNNAINSTKDLSNNMDLQLRLIYPLKTIIITVGVNSSGLSEMRIRILEILSNILQTSGQLFTHGWPDILTMIKSACDDSGGDGEDAEAAPQMKSKSRISPNLIRIGFSSLQLVCSDFLSFLSPETIGQCIECLGAYGSQNSDINISLTSVGLLWNVSDFIQTRRNEAKATKKISRLKSMDELWMKLLLEYVRLCSDYRHEVRNGAIQTLFRTISMNGQLIELWTWNDCIWKVQFSLLNTVKLVGVHWDPISEVEVDVKQAPLGRVSNKSHWDETKSLIITGVVSIFSEYLVVLRKLENFEESWKTLLNYMQEWILLSQSQEVAMSVIKSYQTLVNTADKLKVDSDKITNLWQLLWKNWKAIGMEMILQSNGKYKFECEELSKVIEFDHSQATLTQYMLLALPLIKLLGPKFDLAEVQELLQIIRAILSYHFQGRGLGKTDTMTETWYIDHTSPLQKAIIDVFRGLQLNSEFACVIIPEVMKYSLLSYRKWMIDYSAYGISELINENKRKENNPTPSQDCFDFMFISFSRELTSFMNQKYKDFCDVPEIYSSGVYEFLLKGLGVPIQLKYNCPGKDAYWKVPVNYFLSIIQQGFESLNKNEVDGNILNNIWNQIISIMEGYILSSSQPKAELSLEEQDVDEVFDMSVVNAVCSEMIIHMGKPAVKQELVERMISLLNQVSVLHYYIAPGEKHVDGRVVRTDPINLTQQSEPLTQLHSSPLALDIVTSPHQAGVLKHRKEKLAQLCLRSLFEFCSKHSGQLSPKGIAKTACKHMLSRCKSVMEAYIGDQHLYSSCPFPRVRTMELLEILNSLLSAELQEDIIETTEHSGQVANNFMLKHELLKRPTAHLFYLYPLLCKFIGNRDKQITTLIQQCMEKVGKELQL